MERGALPSALGSSKADGRSEGNVDTSVGQSILGRVSTSAWFSSPLTLFPIASFRSFYLFLSSLSLFPPPLLSLSLFHLLLTFLIIPFHSTSRRSCSRNVVVVIVVMFLLTRRTYVSAYLRTTRLQYLCIYVRIYLCAYVSTTSRK